MLATCHAMQWDGVEVNVKWRLLLSPEVVDTSIFQSWRRIASHALYISTHFPGELSSNLLISDDPPPSPLHRVSILRAAVRGHRIVRPLPQWQSTSGSE